jgi:hypothetical protein
MPGSEVLDMLAADAVAGDRVDHYTRAGWLAFPWEQRKTA